MNKTFLVGGKLYFFLNIIIMKENIIFLDFDGVFILNDVVDLKCVKNLNYIIRETNAKIVISSDWRNHHTINDLEKLFLSWGIKGDIIGVTERHGENSFMFLEHNRTEEIEKFRKDNDVSNYVIIDDLKLYNSIDTINTKYDENFFNTIWYVGLTKSISEKIVNKLNTLN